MNPPEIAGPVARAVSALREGVPLPQQFASQIAKEEQKQTALLLIVGSRIEAVKSAEIAGQGAPRRGGVARAVSALLEGITSLYRFRD